MYHLPNKLVFIYHLLDQGTRQAVRVYGRVSGVVAIITSARQGDILTPASLYIVPSLVEATIATALAQHPHCSTCQDNAKSWW